MKRYVLLALVSVIMLPSFVTAAENMLAARNGSFEQGLEFWLVDFPKHDFLKDNKKFVTTVADGTRPHVLKFTISDLLAETAGVQALSHPVRIDPGKRYKLTVSARTTAPNARFYVMGKRWKPGVKKHNDPTNDELRDSFKGPVLSFSGNKAAQMSDVKRSWATASVEVPQRDLTELAYSFWENCSFVVVHLVGIDGKGGDLFMDDIKLEEVGTVDRSQIKKRK